MSTPTPGTLATFAMRPTTETVELLARAGFDLVIVDLEHGATPLAALGTLSAVAAANCVRMFARTGSPDPVLLGTVLDAGVDGVVVAHVDSAATARGLVAACRYPPAGERSLNPYVRALDYGHVDTSTATPTVLAMIEGRDGLRSADDIIATPGLDGIFVGPFDLAASLGHPGEPEHPDVVAQIDRLRIDATRAGQLFALYADSAAAAQHWLDRGVDIVTYGADLAFMSTAFAAAARDVRAADPTGALL